MVSKSHAKHAFNPISPDNLLAMLCFLWGCHPLGLAEAIAASEDGLDMLNLAAHCLTCEVRQIVRKGMQGAYHRVTEVTSAVRGRVHAMVTLRRGDASIVCSFDRWTVNTPVHRLLAHTLAWLSRQPSVASATRERARSLLAHFSNVDTESPGSFERGHLPPGLKNPNYRRALSLCYFLRDMTAWQEQDRSSPWDVASAKDSLDRRLHFVFERFVRKFYGVYLFHLPMAQRSPRDRRIGARILGWPNTSTEASPSSSVLPKMITDTTIEFADWPRTYVVETKFTPPFTQGYWKKLEKKAARRQASGLGRSSSEAVRGLRSRDIYQILSYLLATRAACLDPSRQINGLLLYPDDGDPVDFATRLYGFGLRVATVDLRGPWPVVEQRLRELIPCQPP